MLQIQTFCLRLKSDHHLVVHEVGVLTTETTTLTSSSTFSIGPAQIRLDVRLFILFLQKRVECYKLPVLRQYGKVFTFGFTVGNERQISTYYVFPYRNHKKLRCFKPIPSCATLDALANKSIRLNIRIITSSQKSIFSEMREAWHFFSMLSPNTPNEGRSAMN